MKSIWLISIGFVAACAMAPPPRELVDARAAYAEAKSGPAAQVAPADLHEAHRALRRAEAAYLDDGNEPRTRDLAYVALRKSEEAGSRARYLMASQERSSAERDIERLEDSHARRTKRELSVTRDRLSSTVGALQDQQRATAAEHQARLGTEADLQARIAERDQALAAQQQATDAARRDAAAAMASLQEIANVREEARGIVVTLNGAVLFATGESTLLPIARERLDQVAATLADVGDRSIQVLGHTDSRGSARQNDELSQHRAEAVRDYLVSRGISPARIRAVGRGAAQPVADNRSAEGRANNRRVEIVVEAPAQTQAQ